MSLPEFSLRLQKGITGGFAPPTPSAIYTVDGTPDKPDLRITAAIRPDGTPSVGSAVPKLLSKTSAGVDQSLGELYTILKSLPTEQPRGSEDIYCLDTSIAFQAEGLFWVNGGPNGCGGGVSAVQATQDEKAKFRRAVDIINKLVEEAK